MQQPNFSDCCNSLKALQVEGPDFSFRDAGTVIASVLKGKYRKWGCSRDDFPTNGDFIARYGYLPLSKIRNHENRNLFRKHARHDREYCRADRHGAAHFPGRHPQCGRYRSFGRPGVRLPVAGLFDLGGRRPAGRLVRFYRKIEK